MYCYRAVCLPCQLPVDPISRTLLLVLPAWSLHQPSSAVEDLQHPDQSPIRMPSPGIRTPNPTAVLPVLLRAAADCCTACGILTETLSAHCIMGTTDATVLLPARCPALFVPHAAP
jgi:hypothetical protein